MMQRKCRKNLLEIHQRLDLLVDKLYQAKAFVDDQERLKSFIKHV